MNLFSQNLTHDPIHGYIRFVAPTSQAEHEVCERSIIDSPWVGRMRQIRQLQTAWWVFPSAEHSRFQHILGVMHLGSKAINRLYESLKQVDNSVPELPVVESIVRMAGLLHDVGHGPFGHFFDAHYLSRFGLNFYHDSSTGLTRPLTMHGLYKQLPISHTIARIYCHDLVHRSQFAAVLDDLLGAPGDDDLTNM